MYGIVRFGSRGKGSRATTSTVARKRPFTTLYLDIRLQEIREHGPFFQGGIMKQICWLQVLCLAGAAACRESTAPVSPSLPSDVAQFLTPLPKLRSASTVFAVPEKGFLLFTASYGDPQDCPAGCFYAQAWGIKYAGRIGWVYGAPGTRYDVRTTDEFLFD